MHRPNDDCNIRSHHSSMKAYLSLLITLVGVSMVGAAEDVIDNPEKCRVDRNFRNLFDRAHNNLRKEKGLEEMIYDCEFEKAASKEEYGAGNLEEKNYGKLVFERVYENSVLEVLEQAFKDLKTDPAAVLVMANPKATRFGCWGRLFRIRSKNEKRTRITCAYDKKYGFKGLAYWH